MTYDLDTEKSNCSFYTNKREFMRLVIEAATDNYELDIENEDSIDEFAHSFAETIRFYRNSEF